MSCVTCEITPPAEHSLANLTPEQAATPGYIAQRLHPGHIGCRLGDTFTLGLAVLYRGRDVTLQCVEAHAGNDDSGWVEMRIVNSDGTPTFHRPGPPICADCGTDWPAEDNDEPPIPGCPKCSSITPPAPKWPAHVVTVIRPGPTTIIRGVDLHTGDDQ